MNTIIKKVYSRNGISGIGFMAIIFTNTYINGTLSAIVSANGYVFVIDPFNLDRNFVGDDFADLYDVADFN